MALDLPRAITEIPPRLDSAATLALHLGALLTLDPRLAPIAAKAGPFEVRKSEGGFAGLARIVTEVSQDAFNRWNERMRRHGKAVQTYIVDCNRGLNSYFVNSQKEVVYYRPQTITGSRRFARRSP